MIYKKAFIWLLFWGILHACKHDPILPKPANHAPIATDCHPDSVYFENEILPILLSNCAMSGCHDQQTAADGIRLTHYAAVMQSGEVKAGRPQESDLYKKLLESRADKRMPPPPYPALAAGQIEKIRVWISQGAQNNACRPQAPCDTASVGFASRIQPLLQQHCVGCHQGATASGGVLLDSYASVRSRAADGRLLGSVAHLAGFAPMPPTGTKLDSCAIFTITAWINQGQQP